MVYLRELLSQNRDKLLQFENIELAAYLFVSSPEELSTREFKLTPEEELSLKGYKLEAVDVDKITTVAFSPPKKGMSATSNIYKFAGLYLSAKAELRAILMTKYSQSDILQKFFLTKVEPELVNNLKLEVANLTDPFSVLIKQIVNPEKDFNDEVYNVLPAAAIMDIDVQKQIVLEEIERTLLREKHLNKGSEEVIRDVLTNFSNAIQKITKNRRKGHPEFEIGDEYDVQDILYVILKSIFPTIRDEDPIPKVGGKSSKIDLILREEGILIEVKMIKASDSNEVEFIEQLKIDFESYHACHWLKKLFCIVYDPNKKTRDISNFRELGGERVKNNHRYFVEVIVVN